MSEPSDRGSRIALRAHYDLRQDPADTGVCIRTARTAHGAEMLPAHFRGWQLTHDLLGDAAPEFAEFDGTRIKSERIPGRALHEYYGAARRGETVPRLPWDQLWKALAGVYESGRPGPGNAKLIPEMAWTTWFSIVRLRQAKRHTLVNAWRAPVWSLRGSAALVAGKLAGGFTTPPASTFETARASQTGLTLGDMHMANLVGNADRIAFVDFSEVGEGLIALDLAPLWMEWWLAQGLVHGDDGFVDGFAGMWRRFAGPETNLIRMTADFTRRMFAWMLFAFHADHLGLDANRAMAATSRALARLAQVRDGLPAAQRLQDLVSEAR